ncbi:PREDICTED: uncharacterized protein LOC106811680 [Priapulus caudatus]|uniref:Uncharacterized protein LOC106811680 n=1 Tax=Priapulus caudatus TaxID=37621 RepID=A0ABM1EF97_PRICU|nr:PREDICTED: uncharacterized protein LOC106811680 [Priapulus caudatus]
MENSPCAGTSKLYLSFDGPATQQEGEVIWNNNSPSPMRRLLSLKAGKTNQRNTRACASKTRDDLEARLRKNEPEVTVCDVLHKLDAERRPQGNPLLQQWTAPCNGQNAAARADRQRPRKKRANGGATVLNNELRELVANLQQRVVPDGATDDADARRAADDEVGQDGKAEALTIDDIFGDEETAPLAADVANHGRSTSPEDVAPVVVATNCFPSGAIHDDDWGDDDLFDEYSFERHEVAPAQPADLDVLKPSPTFPPQGGAITGMTSTPVIRRSLSRTKKRASRSPAASVLSLAQDNEPNLALPNNGDAGATCFVPPPTFACRRNVSMATGVCVDVSVDTTMRSLVVGNNGVSARPSKGSPDGKPTTGPRVRQSAFGSELDWGNSSISDDILQALVEPDDSLDFIMSSIQPPSTVAIAPTAVATRGSEGRLQTWGRSARQVQSVGERDPSVAAGGFARPRTTLPLGGAGPLKTSSTLCGAKTVVNSTLGGAKTLTASSLGGISECNSSKTHNVTELQVPTTNRESQLPGGATSKPHIQPPGGADRTASCGGEDDLFGDDDSFLLHTEAVLRALQKMETQSPPAPDRPPPPALPPAQVPPALPPAQVSSARDDGILTASQQCSPLEIERKRREALQRRQRKAFSSSQESSQSQRSGGVAATTAKKMPRAASESLLLLSGKRRRY